MTRCAASFIHDGSRVRVTMVQMPAVNTPQFDWVKSRLPRKAQPVPPIYQPEVAADAIVWAAEHAPRELSVGGPTPVVIWGNKLAPGLGDEYLARTGFDSQMTDESESPERPNNLYAPLCWGSWRSRAVRRRAHMVVAFSSGRQPTVASCSPAPRPPLPRSPFAGVGPMPDGPPMATSLNAR